MQLVHGNTIAVTPDKVESILGDDGRPYNLSGHGIVAQVGSEIGHVSVGMHVYYNALAGSYIEDLNLVVVDIDNVLITE
jgi:hypothetical protein